MDGRGEGKDLGVRRERWKGSDEVGGVREERGNKKLTIVLRFLPAPNAGMPTTDSRQAQVDGRRLPAAHDLQSEEGLLEGLQELELQKPNFEPGEEPVSKAEECDN